VPRKVALVIGVKNAEGLIPLPGAWTGADMVAHWAEQSGFEVHTFTDRTSPVTRSDIAQAIKGCVDTADVEQLVVYFAGHGVSTGKMADFWLLSAGSEDLAEIVNVDASVQNARDCGIPHVVFISDACRTIAGRKQIGVANGTPSIFPNKPPNPQRAQIDRFFAALTGDAAQEVSDEGAVNSQGVFTSVLLYALTDQIEYPLGQLPDKPKKALLQIDTNTGAQVLYANYLKIYLEQQLPLITDMLQLAAQSPDCTAESSEKVIATLAPPQSVTLTVEAVCTDGKAADLVELDILHNIPQTATFETIQHVMGKRFSATLPLGNIYGVRATLPGYEQKPAAPKPFAALLVGDELLPVSLAPSTPVVLGEPPEPEPGPSLVKTVVLDATGQAHNQAPADGVFTVASTDLLTKQTQVELQVLQRGDLPSTPETLKPDPAAEKQIRDAAQLEGRGHFESQSGLTIYGADVRAAYVADGHEGLFQEGGAWNLRGHFRATGSVVLDLGADRFAATALFHAFLGVLSIGRQGVDHLSYSPAPGSEFDIGDPRFEREARQARALIEGAARQGYFQVALDESNQLAGTLRRYKHYDPVLGIFAAYAYYQAGNIEQIRSLIRYFEERDQAVPYDVVMLAGQHPSDIHGPVAPLFPLLRQGWFLLGPDDTLKPEIAAARRNLAPSLWSTIVGESGRELGRAIEQGAI